MQRFSDRALQIIAEDKIRAAIEAGEFEHLPGMGKPLAVLDEPYDENWRVRRKLRAEACNASAFAAATSIFHISHIRPLISDF